MTAKDQFEATKGECCLYGLDFTKDEQISNWITRAQGNYRPIQLPNTVEGFMNVNYTKKPFNLLRSLDIASINREMEMLHPGTHEFWDNEEIRSKFMDYRAFWSKSPAAYIKKCFYCQDSTTNADKSIDDEEAVEVGFVDSLFEMYKLREEINKARSEIIAESIILSYNYKFGSFLLGIHLAFRSSIIAKAILPKKKELDLQKKIEASRIAYEFLIMQHAALKCILEQKYDKLINVLIYDKFIAPYLLRRYSQYAIVALTRSGALLANQEFLLAFIARKNNWIRRQNLQNKNKEDEQKEKTCKTTTTNCRGNKGTSFIRGGQTTSKKSCRVCFEEKFQKAKKKGVSTCHL